MIVGKLNSEKDAFELQQRSNEIRILIDNKIEVAKENINRKGVNQKEIQNKRNKVVEETLEIGTKVMIKNEGLLKKLEARYRGPYTVVGVTPKKNYMLTDMTGQKLDTTIPRQKLKVTQVDDKGEFHEVEKILKHKVVDNIEMF